MKKLSFIIALAFLSLTSHAQLGHYILNFDSVTVVKRLRILNVLSGSPGTDSLVSRRANGNVTRLHPNQLIIPYANLTGTPNLSLYYLASNPSGYLSSITSSNVTTALGFTPYNATNPSGFTSNTGTVTSVGLSSTDLAISGSPITTSGSVTVNLNTSGVTAGTYDGVTYNSKGIVTSATATNPIYYTSSGVVTNRIKKWEGTVAGTASSGQSIDISSAGFSTILSIQITAKENVNTVKGALVDIQSNTTSAIVINIYRSKITAVLLGGNIEGLEQHPTPTAVTLFVSVTGY